MERFNYIKELEKLKEQRILISDIKNNFNERFVNDVSNLTQNNKFTNVNPWNQILVNKHKDIIPKSKEDYQKDFYSKFGLDSEFNYNGLNISILMKSSKDVKISLSNYFEDINSSIIPYYSNSGLKSVDIFIKDFDNDNEAFYELIFDYLQDDYYLMIFKYRDITNTNKSINFILDQEKELNLFIKKFLNLLN